LLKRLLAQAEEDVAKLHFSYCREFLRQELPAGRGLPYRFASHINAKVLPAGSRKKAIHRS